MIQTEKVRVSCDLLCVCLITHICRYVKEERLLRPHNSIGFVGAFVGDQRHERDERERRRDMRISIKQNKRSSTNAILVLRGLTPRWPPWIHDRIRSRAYS
ncbi:hypothetical protein PRUPE_6G346000 [Prunus persica]|uniref:Uncharacterized protein n=1 Tax=Prunus persica TaxID=3760 RepID=M5WPG6_PRUPE|nr:hypothetical protein PRUPE_6G346000 [Prunus persica]ONI04886.1 hypothetical protein PRUPE_6G346000 [Prunus persica]